MAIVGGGAIAEGAHIPVLRAMPEAEIIGLAEPSAARREALHARWPDVPLFADVEALSGAGIPDAVLVSTPPEHHLGPASWARHHGLHLYLEKPVAASTRDVDAIIEIWKDAESTAMVGLNYRFHPGVMRLAKRLAAGDIGEPIAIQTTFATPAPGEGTWRQSTAAGGGVLADLGSHHLDLFGFITGARITELACVTDSRQSEWDTAAVSARLSNGCFTQSLFAFGATEVDRIEIVGDEGSLGLDRLTGFLVHRPLRHGYTRLDSLHRWSGAMRTGLRDVMRARGEPSYRAALAAFASRIRGRSVSLPSLQDGAHVHRLIETAAEAAVTGLCVPVPPSSPTGNDSTTPRPTRSRD